VPDHRLPNSLPPVSGLLAAHLVCNVKIVLRTPRAIFGSLLLPALLLSLQSGRHPAATQQAAIVAGLTALGVVSAAYMTHASSLVAAREAGALKRWRAMPVPAWCYFAARVGASTSVAIAAGLLTVAAGAGLNGIRPSALALLGLLPTLALAAFAWASIGTAVSSLIPSVDAAWPLLGLTYLPMLALSGGFGPIGNQPAWLASIVAMLPARAVIDAVTRLLEGTGGLSAGDLAVLLAWTGAGLLAAQRTFIWQPR
jgi:ABC-2 type transport system permease protein